VVVQPEPALVGSAPPRSQDTISSSPATEESGIPGTWDWLYRGTTQQGDLRIEQEEWHLVQRGSKLSGDYLRQVTTLSLDQKPYRCNGLLGYLVTTRVRLQGELSGDKLQLRETAIDKEPSPCSSEALTPKTYDGELLGGRLALRWPGGEQQLLRRSSQSKLPPLIPQEGGGKEVLSEAELKLSGVWEWQTRTTAVTDGEGDQHHEREEWHLVDMAGKLAGYYDRIVERSRSRGVFPCNGAPQIRTVTRYTLRGRRTGDHFFMNEQDYSAERSPCENGGRRLDSYRGTVLPMGRLLIEWAGGQQILQRRRE